MENPRYIWCVAYINRTFLHTITKDLERFAPEVKSYIPTVRVLRKQFKNKKHFDEVPMLFNYGFFRLSYEDACNKDYLMRLKVSIQGIYSWLYNNDIPDVDEEGKYVNTLKVGTVKIREITMLKRAALLNSVYSSDDITSVGADDYIILKGYPFDNIPAQVISVNAKRETVTVRLLPDASTLFNEVEVSYSNVFYSIYSNFDDPTTDDHTLDAMKIQVPDDEFRKSLQNEPKSE